MLREWLVSAGPFDHCTLSQTLCYAEPSCNAHVRAVCAGLQGVLSKLSAAKDMMKEMLERERRKRAERDAEKKDAASKAVEPAENVVTS